MPTRTLSLQTKATAGLAFFLAVLAALATYNVAVIQRNSALHGTLGTLGQIALASDSLAKRSRNYIENAPRDFETYDRDVAVYFDGFRSDLASIDEVTEILARKEREGNGGLLGLVGGGARDAELHEGLAAYLGGWTTFRTGLAERLGDDADPRLEWGAEWVDEHWSEVAPALSAIIAMHETELKSNEARVRTVGQASLVAAMLVAVLASTWFYVGIVRGIRRTVEGCERVANGDFGYQMPVARDDELGTLARAFNSLSARARLVLSLLDQLQTSADARAALESVFRESNAYLRAEWTAILAVNPAANRATLVHMVGERAKSFTYDPSMELIQTFPSNDFSNSSPIAIGNIRSFAVEHPQARFLREVGRQGMRSVLLVPLRTDSGWNGLLLFASRQQDAFSPVQVELIRNLAPMLAHAFERAAGRR